MARTWYWSLARSSGKNSAYALRVLRDGDGIEVVGLPTTVNRESGRIATHALGEHLLEAVPCGSEQRRFIGWVC